MIAKDYPPIVTIGLGAAVGAHVVLAHHFHQLRGPVRDLARFDQDWSIYLGYAGVVAVLGGFTGVVVVFAMTPGQRLARLRVAGGDRLEANWLSPVISSLLAAFGAVLATLLAAGDHGVEAAWLFEFVLLVSVHAAIRMGWLLHTLMIVVRRQDHDGVEGANPPAVSLAAELEKRRAR